MTGKRGALGAVGSAAGGLELLRTRLVEPAIERGWDVAVTVTPTAATWLESWDELGCLEASTSLPVRHHSRLPQDERTHPPVDCYVVAPASANTVAKLALGIADNQALTQVCEAIGTIGFPVVLFPRVNAAHARQPAWETHLQTLKAAGVHLVYGPDVWPLYEPRAAPAGRDLPWSAILSTAESAATMRITSAS